MKIFSFSPSPSMVFQISLWILHKNSLSQRLLEGKAVTLWDELTEHKAVSQKASIRFLSEDIYFFTISIQGLPNITLQIPQEKSLQKASWGESWNSVRWINRTQNSFSDRFFPVFIWTYFIFHHNPPWDSKYHFANSKRTVLVNGLLRGKL